MNKFKKITNQELLTELEKRLPDFATDEFVVLFSWIAKYHSEIMKLVQKKSPRIYSWLQEKHQQLHQEKIDEQAEKLKNSLAKKPQANQPK